MSPSIQYKCLLSPFEGNFMSFSSVSGSTLPNSICNKTLSGLSFCALVCVCIYCYFQTVKDKLRIAVLKVLLRDFSEDSTTLNGTHLLTDHRSYTMYCKCFLIRRYSFMERKITPVKVDKGPLGTVHANSAFTYLNIKLS